MTAVARPSDYKFRRIMDPPALQGDLEIFKTVAFMEFDVTIKEK